MMDGVWKPTAPFDKNIPQWPLAYNLRGLPTGQKWWSHIYYRGPENQSIEILYCDSFAISESISRTFLNEPVLGFDMEWPMDADKRTTLQEKVSLIQIACENRVALFHIALHDGHTSQDIIPPSLRRIIESPAILKVGVAILSHDFTRLKNIFQLQPRGAFELSHLHNLVCYGSQDHTRVKTRLRKLTEQVRLHLGLPLQKESVRQSDWSKHLNEEQRTYAANDAYAGFMLFHCMNAKRLEMNPTLPLPKLAESYLPFGMEGIRLVQFEPTGHVSQSVPVISTTGCVLGDKMFSRYRKLLSLRRSAAIARGVPPEAVASTRVVLQLSQYPLTSKSKLLETYNVTEKEARLFSDEWLRILETFEASLEVGSSQTSVPNALTNLFSLKNDRGSKRRRLAASGNTNEAHLPHSTGLSFQLADTRLDANNAPAQKGEGGDQGIAGDSSTSVPSLTS